MFKVHVKFLPLTDYVQLGYKTVNHLGSDYRILCPVEMENVEVDYVTTTKDFKWWGLKKGDKIDIAIPIYPPVPTNSERIEDGQDVY